MFKKTIGFGANTIGGYNLYHDYNFEQSVKVLSAYLNNGGKIIDTAYVYGLGEGEIQIGKMIKDYSKRIAFFDYESSARVTKRRNTETKQRLKFFKRIGLSSLKAFRYTLY